MRYNDFAISLSPTGLFRTNFFYNTLWGTLVRLLVK